MPIKTYLVRVELHDASTLDYEVMHQIMRSDFALSEPRLQPFVHEGRAIPGTYLFRGDEEALTVVTKVSLITGEVRDRASRRATDPNPRITSSIIVAGPEVFGGGTQ